MTSHIQPEASWMKYWKENCYCLEAYKDRGMVDPGCAYCNTFDEVKDAISEAVAAERNRIDEAIRELSWLQNNSAVKELEENTMYLEAAQVISILHNKQ